MSTLAQPSPVSRVSIRLFPVFEGVSASGTPDEETFSEEGMGTGRWRGQVTLRLGDAVITADGAVVRDGEWELGGNVVLRAPVKTKRWVQLGTPAPVSGSSAADRWTYFLLADEALFVLADAAEGSQELAGTMSCGGGWAWAVALSALAR